MDDIRSSGYNYHVFLSFRDDDTGKNFSDHLYAALEQTGIHTYRGDDGGFERGDNVNEELEKAMLESKLCIVVFSKGYASSVGCLDELVKVMELRRNRGLVVVPVFYDADPGIVWEQSGSYAEAFARHEEAFKEEMFKVEKWRKMLREITDLSGMDLQGRHEAEFIQDIVRKVEKRVNRIILLHSPSYLVGIDSRVKDINLWLQNAVNDTATAIIYGIGGIGKTTIAKIVYNQNLDRFEGSCFLADIREASRKPDSLILLQKYLLEKLVTGKVNKIDSVDEGSMMIKDAISCKRVLIVFDDVDQLDQLTKIIGPRDSLHRGSKIIITTRHEGLLKAHDMYRKFRVEELDPNESLELFSWHAFGQNHPIEECMEQSEIVVQRCHGNPFALQVLGSSLSVKIADGWGKTLEKLKAIPDSRIQESLRISYDSLQDDHDKNLFLDIACFFVGRDKDFAAKILNGCEYHTEVGIQNLIDRHLVEINEDNKLMMHPLFRVMGREIIRQESPENPGKRSRLWYHEDSLTVLRENIGTEAIKGLTFNQCMIMENQYLHRISCTHCAKRHYYQELISKSTPKRRCLGFFSRKPVENDLITSVPVSNEVVVETKAFSKMRKLKVLKFNDVKLHGGYEHFPKSLIWLSWHGFPTKSIQPNMYLEKIVVLDMRYSSLKLVWNGPRVLLQLKILNLSYSCDLVTTSNLSGLPNLEKLKLKGCINLAEVHESIGDLKRLVLLNLKDCKSLTKLPRTIGMLRSLEELNISGCSKLYKLPSELGRIESLKVLHADGLLHSATTSQHSTFLSWLSKRQGIQSLLSLNFLPHSLESLSLADCKLSDIPVDISNFSSLKYLNLSRNSICSLPETTHSLSKLEFLVLDHCSTLQSLPQLPTTLKELSAEKCTSLEKITNLPNCTRSFKLNLTGCMKLVEVQGLFKLEPITNIDREIANRLNLFNLEPMRSIKLEMSCVTTLTSRIIPLQVLHECGICSIFLPGSEIPEWYNPQNKGSSISFGIPALHGRKICGLNTSTVYTRDNSSNRLDDHHYIKIWNKSQDLKLIYSPTFYGIPQAQESMVWFSHWKIGDRLEGGDELNVSVVMSSGYEVKEFGIYVVYEDEEEDTQLNSEEMEGNESSWYRRFDCMDSDIYRVGREEFFLCNHAYLVNQLEAFKYTKSLKNCLRR
ncbi:disease resistance protein RPV1-like isoform X2 [Euphorbia lathyris]|uniref:disease resistance protein RPV1-like isoform X2 n=1 Tax=Euphorbia lathyris TaxID=212925 RepID=UPI0033133869